MEKFTNYLRKKYTNRHTVQGYTRGVQAYARWFANEMGEEFTLAKLYGPDVEKWKRGQNPNTFNLRLAALRELVRMGLDTGALMFDPLADVNPAQAQELAPKWLTKAARGKLLRTAQYDIQTAQTETQKRKAIHRNAVAHLMLYGGLRVDEVTHIQTDGVQISERKGSVIVKGKGSKTRYVALNKQTRHALALWMDYAGDANLFDGMSKRTHQRAVRELGERAGVDVTAHQLRHTCAKTMLDAGADLTVVAAHLGHANLETTKRYTMPGEHDLHRAVEMM